MLIHGSNVFSRMMRLIFILIIAVFLSACGYHLRGDDSQLAKSFYLEGLPASDPFWGVLDNALLLTGGKRVTSLATAAGIIHLYRATHQRRSITLGSQGRATEFDLTYRIVFDIRTTKGEIVLPRQELEVKRDYFNDQSLPLAQGEEESLIKQELEKEATTALLRRAGYAIKRSPAQ